MTHQSPPDYTQAGPQLGARFPDVSLPDQRGALVNVHEVRGDNRAIIVFHRSARW